MQNPAIAVALIDGSSGTWELRLDGYRWFRWYLNGTVETNLGGFSVQHAEAALRQFVDDCLRGELIIAHPTRLIGPRSESGHSAVKSAGAS